ncbi:MAG: hypothetical protein FJX70_06440 [Alphaproteobacteria bacterium]|jgi:hypothetical protein|nr:hypothetical protein [Alphaproteobacteria bacterium]
MSKDYDVAYKAIKDKAIEIRNKGVGVDKVVVVPPLPDKFADELNAFNMNNIKALLVSLKPYKDADTSKASLEVKEFQMEVTNTFNDAESFYTEITGQAPNYE